MYALFYIYLMVFGAILFSIILGNSGMAFPVPAAVIFYLTIVYGWRVGVIVAATTGVVLELLYGSASFTPLVMLSITGIAQFWLYNYDTKKLAVLMIPGAIVGCVLFLPKLLFYEGAWLSILYLIPELLFSVVVMVLLMPLTIYVMDKLAKFTGLPLFTEAKIKLIHQKR